MAYTETDAQCIDRDHLYWRDEAYWPECDECGFPSPCHQRACTQR